MQTRCALLLLALALEAPARTAEPPQVGPLTVPQDARHGVMRLLEGIPAAPVVAVGFGANPEADSIPIPSGDLEARFKAAADAIGTPTVRYAVTKQGGAWVIAPTLREDVSPAAKPETPLQLTARGVLVARALARMNAQELRKVASPEGLALSSASQDGRTLVAAALRGPIAVMESRPLAPGEKHVPSWERRVTQETHRWDAAPAALGIRAWLRLTSFKVDGASERKPTQTIYLEPPARMEFAEAVPPIATTYNQVQYPPTPFVPNTLKPSDLSASKFRKPLGMRGVYHLKDVVAGLARLIGLRLVCARDYEDMPVLIGSVHLTCGDVMDAVCLGISGAWRKVGGLYLLTWDRRGFAAAQRVVIESSAAAASEAEAQMRTERVDSIDSPSPWAALPFASNDPLALTPNQRSALLRPRENFRETRSIPWAAMTATQQAEVRRIAAVNSAREDPCKGTLTDPPCVWWPISDDDLKTARLDGELEVVVSINVAGVGWVEAPPRWYVGRVIAPFSGTASSERPVPAPASAALVALDIPSRAVMCGALGPVEVKRLVREMGRTGFTYLFYPVLIDGYATFPGKAFPLHPGLRGADGWAAAAAACKAAGVRLIGYLNTLTWRPPTRTPHWMVAHRDWIDVDVLGRTTNEWVLSGSPGKPDQYGANARDYVRPADPAVQAKLDAIVAEFARRPAATGIAFAMWMPPNDEHQATPRVPNLGFALPERLDSIERDHVDPIDNRYVTTFYTPIALTQPFKTYQYNYRRYGPQYESLTPWHEALVSLLSRAKQARSDWKAFVISDGRPMPYAWSRGATLSVPQADAVLSSNGFVRGVEGYVFSPGLATPRPRPGNPFARLPVSLQSMRKSNPSLNTVIIDITRTGPSTLKWFTPRQ